MNEFLKIVFGDFPSWATLFGYAWFFVIAYIVYALSETSYRDVNSSNTPKKWSWKFWYFDNWRRYLVTILSSYLFFRFYTDISGHPFSNFDAVSLGLIGDGIGATLKERVRMIGGNREELTMQIKRELGEIG